MPQPTDASPESPSPGAKGQSAEPDARPARERPPQSGRQETSDPASARATEKKAILFINTRPWSEVRMNGTSLGATPILSRRVDPGRKVLEFRNPAHGVQKRIVHLKPGKTLRISFALDQE